MSERRIIQPNLIVPPGTRVVLRVDISPQEGSRGFAKGSVGEIVRLPADIHHSYGVRLVDGRELTLHRREFSLLKQVKTGALEDPAYVLEEYDLRRYVIYECIVGSQAFGLSREGSDIDKRGIYLPPADFEWSLYGVPEQLENRETEECYWELKKFIILALKANPNILECLYSPLVEKQTPIAEEILAKREIFLSKLVYQTYNGYVMGQFKKLEQDLRATGSIKWKHAMHLIRLLLQGIFILREKMVEVRVTEHRAKLLEIRDGVHPWSEVNAWRLALHGEFDAAFQRTTLPDLPDYAAANRLLLQARRSMVNVE